MVEKNQPLHPNPRQRRLASDRLVRIMRTARFLCYCILLPCWVRRSGMLVNVHPHQSLPFVQSINHRTIHLLRDTGVPEDYLWTEEARFGTIHSWAMVHADRHHRSCVGQLHCNPTVLPC